MGTGRSPTVGRGLPNPSGVPLCPYGGSRHQIAHSRTVDMSSIPSVLSSERGDMPVMRELTQDEADQIKVFLLKTPLQRPIRLAFPEIPMAMQITDVIDWEWDNEGRDFSGTDGVYPLTYQGRAASLSLQVCSWSSASRLDAVHVVLGSNHPALDPRFVQIELGDCLTDGDTVLLVKSTRRAGRGAISRMKKGTRIIRHPAGDDFDARVQLLIERLGARVIKWREAEFIVVATIPLDRMLGDPGRLFPEILEQLLRYAGEVETLRLGLSRLAAAEALDAGSAGKLSTHGFRYRLTPEERKRVELSGMAAATEWLEGHGFSVSDVSARNLGYDLLAASGSEELSVEVKSTTVAEWAVEFTANEMRCATQRQNDYMLIVVVLDGVDSLAVTEMCSYRNPAEHDGLVVAPYRYILRPSGAAETH